MTYITRGPLKIIRSSYNYNHDLDILKLRTLFVRRRFVGIIYKENV
jgi:hypothetical protein